MTPDFQRAVDAAIASCKAEIMKATDARQALVLAFAWAAAGPSMIRVIGRHAGFTRAQVDALLTAARALGDEAADPAPSPTIKDMWRKEI